MRSPHPVPPRGPGGRSPRRTAPPARSSSTRPRRRSRTRRVNYRRDLLPHSRCVRPRRRRTTRTSPRRPRRRTRGSGRAASATARTAATSSGAGRRCAPGSTPGCPRAPSSLQVVSGGILPPNSISVQGVVRLLTRVETSALDGPVVSEPRTPDLFDGPSACSARPPVAALPDGGLLDIGRLQNSAATPRLPTATTEQLGFL